MVNKDVSTANRDNKDESPVYATAYGTAAILFGTLAWAPWPSAIPVHGPLQVWLTRIFACVFLLNLYMCFAETWGWPPSSRSRAAAAGGDPSLADGQARAKGLIAASVLALLAVAVIGGELAGLGRESPAGAHPRGTRASAPAAVKNVVLTAPGGAALDVVAMSGDDKYVAAAGADGDQPDIYLWTDNGQFLKKFTPQPGATAETIAFTQNDALVVVCYSSSTGVNTVYRIALPTGGPVQIDHFRSSSNWALSGDGNTLAFLSAEGDQIDIHYLDSGDHSAITLPYSAKGWAPHSMQLDDSADEVIISSNDDIVYAMGTGAGAGTSTAEVDLRVPFQGTTDPELSPDGSTILVPAAGNGATLWAVPEYGSPQPKSGTAPDDPGQWPVSNGAFAYSSDGAYIMAFADHGVSADLWEESPLTHRASVPLPNTQDQYLAFLGAGAHQFIFGHVTDQGDAFTELYVQDLLPGQ